MTQFAGDLAKKKKTVATTNAQQRLAGPPQTALDRARAVAPLAGTAGQAMRAGVTSTGRANMTPANMTQRTPVNVSVPQAGGLARTTARDMARRAQVDSQMQYDPGKGLYPSSREVLAKIATVAEKDRAQGEALLKEFSGLMQDASSPYYNPYSTASNKKALQNLSALLGEDLTGGVSDEWLEANKHLLKGARYTTTGEAPAAPTSKSSAAENAAYWYYQLLKDGKTTRNAEAEWTALQDEIALLASDPRSYSDEEILGMLDMGKYSTLRQMDEAKENGVPVSLNRAVGYSQDALYGALWAARNGGSSGNALADMTNYTLGRGAKYVADAEAVAARDPNSDAYNPNRYTTLTAEQRRFGVEKFDRAWAQANRHLLESNNAADVDGYRKVLDALDNQDALDAEIATMQGRIQDWVKSGLSDREIRGKLENELDSYKYIARLEAAKQGEKPMALPGGTEFSTKYLDGMIWAARNDGGTGSYRRDAEMAAKGVGKQYVPDPESEAARVPGTDEYHPYLQATWQKGADWDDGDTSWQQHLIVDEKTGKPKNPGTSATPEQADAWARHEARDVQARTETAKEDLAKLNGYIDENIARWVESGQTTEQVMARVQSYIEGSVLEDMEEYRQMGGKLPLTEAVDFTLPRLEANIRQRLTDGAQAKAAAEEAARREEILATEGFSWAAYDLRREDTLQAQGEIEANNQDIAMKRGLMDFSRTGETEDAQAKAWLEKYGFLLGGEGVVRSSWSGLTKRYDSRAEAGVGKVALAALEASDSQYVTQAQRVDLAMQVSRDMEKAQAQGITLDAYYGEHPQDAVALAWVHMAAQEQEEQAIARQADERELAITDTKRALDGAMGRYATGEPTSEDMQLLAEMQRQEVDMVAALESPALSAAIEEIAALSGRDNNLVDLAANWEAMGVYREHMKYAQMLGISVDELYERYPEMQTTPEEALAWAERDVARKWDVQEAQQQGVLTFLFGPEILQTAQNEGVGVGQTLVKGGEKGVIDFAKGYVSAADWMAYRLSAEDTVAKNRSYYERHHGLEGRRQYLADAQAAIAELQDEGARAYWTEQFAQADDVYAVPFNIGSEKLQDTYRQMDTRLKDIQDFMLTNATTAEYVAYSVESGIVQNVASLTVATAAGGGLPGLIAGYGLPNFGESAQDAYERGHDVDASKLIGLGHAAVTVVTEKIPLDRYMDRITAAFGGNKAIEEIGSKALQAVTRTAQGGMRIMADAGAEGIQEFVESLAGGTLDELVDGAGLTGIDWRGLFADAGREGVMGMLTAPFLSGYASTVGRATHAVSKRVLSSGREISMQDLQDLADARAQDMQDPAFASEQAETAKEARKGELVTEQIKAGAMDEVVHGPQAQAFQAAQEALAQADTELKSASKGQRAAARAQEEAAAAFQQNPADKNLAKAYQEAMKRTNDAKGRYAEAKKARDGASTMHAKAKGALDGAMQARMEELRIAADEAAVQEINTQTAQAAVRAQEEAARSLTQEEAVERYLDERGVQGVERDTVREEILTAQAVEQADVDAPASAPANTALLDALARRAGVAFAFDEAQRQEGRYDPASRTITFGQGTTAGDAWMGVVRHELTHAAEGTAEYGAYADFVLGYEYGENAALLEQAIADKVAAYAAEGVTLDEKGARAEVVADLTRDVILRDDAALVRLAKENRTLGQKLLGWIREALDKLKALGMNKAQADEYATLNKAQRLLSKALDAQGGGNVQGDTQFSIQRMEDGTPYVKVDVDQERFEGLNPAQKRDAAIKAIRERFQGKTIGPSGNQATVYRRSAKKYASSMSPADNAIHNAKMRASTELDNLLSTSELITHSADNGTHENAVGGWDYYRTIFDVGGELYQGTVNIVNEKDARVFYDINQIEEYTKTGSDPVVGESASPTGSAGIEANREAYRNPGASQDTAYPVDNTNSIPAPNQEINPDSQYSVRRMAGATDFRQWDAERIARYGALEKGERAQRDVQLPKQTSDGMNTRRFTRTFLESGSLTDAVVPAVADAVMQEALSYEGITDQWAMEQADAIMAEGAEHAMEQWKAAINKGMPGKNDIALGEMLLHEAAKNGDAAQVVRLVAELAEAGTRAGQAVQAMRMLKKIGGVGQLYYVQRSVDRLNGDNRNRKRFKPVVLDEQLAADLANAKTEGETERASNAIMQNIAEQVPPTWLDKWNAWRYLSMLGNPRTHIRNVIGNGVFVPAVKMKNLIGAGLEAAFVKEGDRTKSVAVKKEYRDFARADYAVVEDVLTGNGKMNPMDAIQEQRRSFGDGVVGRALEKVSNLNTNLLEAEDALFLKAHYTSALAGYLQANKIDLGNVDAAMLERAREYAVLEAKKATYRDNSLLAERINAFTRGDKDHPYASRALGVVVEGVLPFKKTPINILKRGVEYSPVGLLRSFGRSLQQLKNEKYTTAELIDGWASGLTGTGIFLLGTILRGAGILTAGLGDTPEDEFGELTGKQEYSINIGGHSYTIDWMAPAAMPLFAGAEAYRLYKAEAEERGIADWATMFYESLKSVTEPAFNLSMLDGVNSLIDSVSYSDNSMLSMLEGVGTSYLSQAVPTVAGQVARTIDGTRRRTYADKNVGVPANFQLAAQRVMNKIPGASMASEPWVNKWGEQDYEPNVAIRFLENFVSPGYASSVEMDAVERELDTLYTATQDESVLPRNAAKYFSLNGNRIDLTAKEYTEFATVRGQTAHTLLEALFASEGYAALEDHQKADAVAGVYEYANDTAKAQVSDFQLDSWKRELSKAEDKAGYMVERQVKKEEERVITTFRENLYAGVLEGNYEVAMECIEGLRLAGKDKGSVKSSLTGRMKEAYKAAYDEGDMETVSVIEDMLLALGLGYSMKDITKWGLEE